MAVDLSENSDSTTVDISLDELEGLGGTAGGVVLVGGVVKKKAFPPGI